MIADWRTKFGLPDLSFFYVSLAAFADHRFAYLRSAQDAALALPRVGRALAIDLGDPSSPEGSIHPRRKQEESDGVSHLQHASFSTTSAAGWLPTVHHSHPFSR